MNHIVLTLLVQLTFHKSIAALVIGITEFNTTQEFDDLESAFGSEVGENGLTGYLIISEPLNACKPLKIHPEFSNLIENSSTTFMVLIERGGCDFAVKVLNAQNAHFDAAIVYNDISDSLVRMNSNEGSISQRIVIPSVFVGLTSGVILKDDFTYDFKYPLWFSPMVEMLRESDPFPLKYYLIPFCVVIGTCFVCLVLFLIIRSYQTRRRQRRNRLSRQRLKQLPVKQFAKGDEYDVCAICLDDYEEGEKLRILPCQHAYHCKCVDPWLTSSKRVCPLCKRRVLSDDETSNFEADYDDNSSNEEAPLLGSSAAASPNAPRYGTGFTRVNPFTRSYSTSTDGSVVENASLRSYEPVTPSYNPVPEVPECVIPTPEFYSVPESTQSTVVACADVASNNAVSPSSVASSTSLLAYSCQSNSTTCSHSSCTESAEENSHVVVFQGSAASTHENANSV